MPNAIHGIQIQHGEVEFKKLKLLLLQKRVLFKADYVFWTQKGVVGATKWVQNTLDGDQRCLFIIYICSNANGPSMDIACTQTAPK